MAKVEKRPDGIWAWKGTRQGKPGYARFLIGYEPFYVNRISWVIFQRKTNPEYQIPDDLKVCHRNDVTKELYDVNPDNLWLGTDMENARDRHRKRRTRSAFGQRNGTHTHPEKLRRGSDHHAKKTPLVMARGERQGHAKLKWNQVHEIRALYATGKFTQGELGERFGVTKHNIKSIVLWKSWITPAGNAFEADSTP